MSMLGNIIRKMLRKDAISEFVSRGGRIGGNANIFDTKFDGLFPWLITIGDNVTLTGVQILAHDASTKRNLGYTKIGKVSIGNDVFIGRGTIILPNVRIGNNVVIGAGSIVTSDIPDNSIAVGNPCRVIGTCDEYMEKQKKIMDSSKIVVDKVPKDLTKDEIDKIINDLEGIGFIR